MRFRHKLLAAFTLTVLVSVTAVAWIISSLTRGAIEKANEERTAALCSDNLPGVTINRVGSMFTFFFTTEPVFDYDSAKKCDTARFGRFFHHMLEHGVYLAPSQFEAGFVGYAHTAADIDATREAARQFFAAE